MSAKEKNAAQQRIQSQLTKQQREKAKSRQEISAATSTASIHSQPCAPLAAIPFSGPLINEEPWETGNAGALTKPDGGAMQVVSTKNDKVVQRHDRCEVCNCWLSGKEQQYLEHCRGRRHQSNLSMQASLSTVPSTSQVTLAQPFSYLPPTNTFAPVPQIQSAPVGYDMPVFWDSGVFPGQRPQFQQPPPAPPHFVSYMDQRFMPPPVAQCSVLPPPPPPPPPPLSMPPSTSMAPTSVWSQMRPLSQQPTSEFVAGPARSKIPSLFSIKFPDAGPVDDADPSGSMTTAQSVTKSKVEELHAPLAREVPQPSMQQDKPTVSSAAALPSSTSSAENKTPGWPRTQSSAYVYISPHLHQEQQLTNTAKVIARKISPLGEAGKGKDGTVMDSNSESKSSTSNAVLVDGESSEFFCPVCRIRTRDAQSFRAHLASALHIQNGKEKGHKFKTFKCDICNVRGIPYSDESFMQHLISKSHLCMKGFILNDLIHQASEPDDGQKKYIFKFSDRGGGLVECTLCNRVFPSATELMFHQQSDSHGKKLRTLNEKYPVLYVCELCEVSSLGKDASMKHMRLPKHLRAVTKSLVADCPTYYRLEICKGGDQCPFRHCVASLATTETCPDWVRGTCKRISCPRRHPNLVAANLDEQTVSKPDQHTEETGTKEPPDCGSDNSTAKVPFAFSPANVQLLKKLVESKVGKPILSAEEKSGSNSGTEPLLAASSYLDSRDQPIPNALVHGSTTSPPSKTMLDNDPIPGGDKTEQTIALLAQLVELGATAKKDESGIIDSLSSVLQRVIANESEPKRMKSVSPVEETLDPDQLYSHFEFVLSNPDRQISEEDTDKSLVRMLRMTKQRYESKLTQDQAVKLLLMEQLLEKRLERRTNEKKTFSLLEALAGKNECGSRSNVTAYPTSGEGRRELAMDYFLRSTAMEDDAGGTKMANDEQKLLKSHAPTFDSNLQASTSGAEPQADFQPVQGDILPLLAGGAGGQGNLVQVLTALLSGQATDNTDMLSSLVGQMNPAIDQFSSQLIQQVGMLLNGVGVSLDPALLGAGLYGNFNLAPSCSIPVVDFSVPPPALPPAQPSPTEKAAVSAPTWDEDDPETKSLLESGPLTMSTGLNAVHTFSKAELEEQLRRFASDDGGYVPFVFAGKDWAESTSKPTAGEADPSEGLNTITDSTDMGISEEDLSYRGQSGSSKDLRVEKDRRRYHDDKYEKSGRESERLRRSRREEAERSRYSRGDDRRFRRSRSRSRRSRSRSRGDRRRRGSGDLREKLKEKVRRSPTKERNRIGNSADQVPGQGGRSVVPRGYSSNRNEKMIITVPNDLCDVGGEKD